MAALKEPGMDVEQAGIMGEQNALAGAARKLMLFYFGAAASAVEEGYALVHWLAEQREAAEKEGRRWMDEREEKRRAHLARVEAEFNSQAAAATPRIEAPKNLTLSTRADFDALNEKVARLTKKIDEIAREK